jgi:hypothetical protein
MTARFTGGLDVAMKVPHAPARGDRRLLRDTLGLKPLDREDAVGFEFGPVRLWIDHVPTLGQAEVWLELFTEDFEAAARHLEGAGVVRNDAIEPLPEGLRGGWFINPASIVHMVREPDA